MGGAESLRTCSVIINHCTSLRFRAEMNALEDADDRYSSVDKTKC